VEYRYPQVELLINAFRMMGLEFERWEVTDDSNRFAYAGEDFLLSRHGERNGFVFQNKDGGILLHVGPSENPNFKYRIVTTLPLQNADDAYKIATKYNLIFGGPRVA